MGRSTLYRYLGQLAQAGRVIQVGWAASPAWERSAMLALLYSGLLDGLQLLPVTL
jgi:hypothetical protein